MNQILTNISSLNLAYIFDYSLLASVFMSSNPYFKLKQIAHDNHVTENCQRQDY